MSNELTHHGIKGQKWGVRRFQNKDGSLTDAGKKKISKQYEKAANKVTDDLRRNYNSMRINAYNKAADDMNSGGIKKFNAAQERKYGKNFAKRAGYTEDYQAAFEKRFVKHFNESLNDFYESNNHYQKAKKLVEKYDMAKWDDLAKNNEKAVASVRKAVKENK